MNNKLARKFHLQMSGLLLSISCIFKAHHSHLQLAPEDIEKGERGLVCTCMQMLLPKKSSIAASLQRQQAFFIWEICILRKELGYLQDTFQYSLNGKSSPYSYNLLFWIFFVYMVMNISCYVPKAIILLYFIQAY